MYEALLKATPEYQKIAASLAAPGPAALFGLPPAGRALLYAALQKDLGRVLCIVTPGEAEATHFAEDLKALGLYSNFQWALENTGKNNGKVSEDIKPTTMWNKKSTEKDTPVVAIIDSGVDYTHPDLKDKMWVNPYQNKLKGVHGFDFTGTIDDGEPMDDAGHGTHCAGIIGATRNNNEGVSGVADNVKIMAIKFLTSSGMGTTEDAVSAYNYIYNAMKLGVNVVAINNSWGSNENSKILLNIINKVGKAGAVSVCAAGNDGTDFDAEEEYTGENDGDDDDGEMIFKKDIFDDDD